MRTWIVGLSGLLAACGAQTRPSLTATGAGTASGSTSRITTGELTTGASPHDPTTGSPAAPPAPPVDGTAGSSGGTGAPSRSGGTTGNPFARQEPTPA